MMVERFSRWIDSGEPLENAVQIQGRKLSIATPLERCVLGPSLTTTWGAWGGN